MSESTKKPASEMPPSKQLESFIAKSEPATAKLIRGCRPELRKRLPTALELVYDNYNVFVIGYCATGRPSDNAVAVVAARARPG